MKPEIAGLLERAARELYAAAPAGFTVAEPAKGIEADYASNIALLLAPALKRPPLDIAGELAGRLQSAPGAPFRRVEAARGGFLNFTLDDAVLRAVVRRILEAGDRFGAAAGPGAGSVLIEFVSANPTGPLHIGHGRGAALGDSLARIYRQRGIAVETEYYVNDMGIQMRILADSVRARHAELEGRADPAGFPKDGYQGDYVVDIARDMRRSGRSDFDRFPKEYLLDVIRGDLESFGVRLDRWFAESSLHEAKKVEEVLSLLSSKGAVKEKDGALWFSQGAGEADGKEPDKDRVLRKSDGRYTYFASDVAYHKEKFDRGYALSIDIWGHDHHGYVPRVLGAVQALGLPAERLAILLYQLVSLKRGGKKVSMSTRSGTFVTLKEILDEVGRDACRFFFAMRSPSSQLEFDVDLAKRQSQENPVFYVQYVHARICSLFREAEKRGLAPGPGAIGLPESFRFEKEERDLALKLGFFEETLEACLQFHSPHILTNYLMDLAGRFHKFYDRHRVLEAEPEVRQGRLALLAATRTLVRLGLSLLGVSAPESM